MKLWLALVAFALVACAEQCTPVQPPPPGPVAGSGGAGPVPVVLGGTTGAGGQASAYEQCVREQSADPVVANVATQSGRTLSSLVDEMCRDKAMQGGYR